MQLTSTEAIEPNQFSKIKNPHLYISCVDLIGMHLRGRRAPQTQACTSEAGVHLRGRRAPQTQACTLEAGVHLRGRRAPQTQACTSCMSVRLIDRCKWVCTIDTGMHLIHG